MPAAKLAPVGRRLSDAAQLAIVLRQAQWDIDNLAFELPTDQAGTAECRKLADELTELATLLRRYPG
ncbi:hypothetical protein [Saccharopolyspora soli]|uniref:hypothetical protein n=1 Tax=Saccharopolyspora soli TaxID=2926618 RepID=UPI0035571EA3